jgi:hypothetical protein
MPGGTITTNDIEQTWGLAGSMLFGDTLKDYVSEEKRTEIYKKISLIRVLYNATAYPELLGDYPKVQAIVADGNEEQLVKVKENAGTAAEIKTFIDHPEIEKLINLHREGLRELSELLDERLSKGNFKSLSEQNYCYMVKSFIDGLAAGKSFTQSIMEDKQFEFAYNMTAKIRTSSASFTVTDGNFKPIPIYANDSEVIKRIESTGIVNSMAGGKRINDLTQKHLENGDIARGELLEEYKQQQKRIQKHFALTEESFNELKNSSTDLKLFDNEYHEIAGQPERGFLWAKVDLDTKIEAMEAGWPVSDLRTLARYTELMNSLEVGIQTDERLIKANKAFIAEEMKKEAPNQDSINRWNQEIAAATNRSKNYDEALTQMREAWYEVSNGAVDASERKERLQNLQKTLNDLSAKELKNISARVSTIKGMFDERLNAKLAEHEKALLANTATEMLEVLEGADPALVKSSDAFIAFKKELKKLAGMEEDGECNVREEEYREQATKVMEAGAAYLRYKTKQLHKDSSHKRSDLEERRVRTVDSIIARLNVAKIPGSNSDIHSDAFNPIYNKGFEPDVIFEEVIDKSVKNYDNYIKLHTGRIAMNGTREEMIEDLSKVIAAQALKKAYGEPFSKAEIDKQAKSIRVLYNLDEIRTKNLAKALSTPEKAESFIKNRQKELSEVKGLFIKNSKKEYSHYKLWWNNMSALYRIMKDPNSYKNKSEPYKKLFETVKEAAHMPRPENLGKMSKELIEKKVAQLNFRMMQYANIAVDEKGFQEKDMNHDSLHVLYTLKTFTSGAESIINDIDNRIDKKRYDKDPESLKFVSEGYYGANILYPKRKELNHGEELRKPNEEEIQKNTRFFHKNRSAYTYMGNGLDVETAFDGKYKDKVLIDGELPKEKAKREAAARKKANGPKKANEPKNQNVPKVTQEEPEPKVNRPHL